MATRNRVSTASVKKAHSQKMDQSPTVSYARKTMANSDGVTGYSVNEEPPTGPSYSFNEQGYDNNPGW